MFLAILTSLSKKERIAFAAALIIFVMAAILLISDFLAHNAYYVAAYGGEWREGIASQPVFINPILPTTEADQDVSSLVFARLGDMTDAITQVNPTTWDVHLKQGLKWQDGAPITADDVVFTINTIEDPNANSPLFASYEGVRATRLSELSVRFTIPTPYVFFAKDHIENLGVIPAHIFSGIPSQNMRLSQYGLSPVGSGPYKVDSYAHDSNGFITSISLSRNSNYFGEKPHIANIVIKFYKSNSDMIAAFNSGAIDGFGLPTSNLLKDVTLRHKTHLLNSPRYYAIFMNQNANPSLASLGVRQALDGTIDKSAMVNGLFNGDATPMYGPSTGTPNQNTNFNPSLVNGLNLTLTVPNDQFLIDTAEEVQQAWKSYGATTTIDVVNASDLSNKVLKGNNYELLLFGNIVKGTQDLFSFWDSSQFPYPGQNLSLYKNSRVDSLLEDYRSNQSSSTRASDLSKASSIIAQDTPAIFLYSPEYVYVSSPDLQGFGDNKIINTSDDLFSDVSNWYVKTRIVLK
ncbi:MAG: ABC transporter substrate-binding protein [Patescibacteria group bacterium]|nr:ABC transporter substrate-binding protein [Patescibacteria group bacterium]